MTSFGGLGFEDLCIQSDRSVTDALEMINLNGRGVVFVVSPERHLIGSVSDGDVRRALATGRLEGTSSVQSICNPDPSYLTMGSGSEATFQALSRGVSEGKRVFPRVDAAGRVVSFSSQDHWGLVPISEPSISTAEFAKVLECLESGWISSSGPYVVEFEERFADYTQLKNPVAVMNGTVALTLALQALGLPRQKEVIVPNLTFGATANAVIAAGGRPVFVDVDPDTWLMTPQQAAEAITSDTWGILPVHLYGNAVDSLTYRRLCDDNGLMLVEDCAEAIGSQSDGRHVGHLADAACFSFFGNKTLTTGEGGMAFFQEANQKSRALQLRDHGMSSRGRYWHDVAGFNYRLTNLQAAVGVAQVSRARELVESKLRLAGLYLEEFASQTGVVPMREAPGGRCSYWLVPVLVEVDRDRLMEQLAADGIQTRPVFNPLNKMPAFSEYVQRQTFPESERISMSGICFPNNPTMTEETVSKIAAVLRTEVAMTGS